MKVSGGLGSCHSLAGELPVSIWLRTRCTIRAHSSTPRPVLCLIHSISFSKCCQKNSGRCSGATCLLATWAMLTCWWKEWHEAQIKAQCMIILTIHTAVADSCLSCSGLVERCRGSPRSYPVLVVSFLYAHKHSIKAFGYYCMHAHSLAVVLLPSSLWLVPPIPTPHSRQALCSTGRPHCNKNTLPIHLLCYLTTKLTSPTK